MKVYYNNDVLDLEPIVYNYREAIKSDVLEVLNSNDYDEIIQALEDLKAEEISEDEAQDIIYDLLWCNDSVTGNGSGSYYCNAWRAEEALFHNMGLLEEAFNCFDYGINEFVKGPEFCDVTIRCYLLSEAISEALEEIMEG